ncbi:MAG: hypothetical protein FE78DRAFT_155351 [Acidomyces sp. 'richmondensis']|nr:MAG: hypothetical protein FE78DRAFT_155351 [Acidomyces sp. 'richmondensis']
MAEYPPDTTYITLPVYRDPPDPTSINPETDKITSGTQQFEYVDNLNSESPSNDVHARHEQAGKAIIRQKHTIPPTGKRMPTSKWEYIFFTIFYFSNNGALIANTYEAIGGNGGALRQALINEKFPNDQVRWGGQTLPRMLMMSILYRSLLIFQTVLYITQFAMIGMSKPDQWAAAQALYVVGSLSANIVTAFYAATFPGLVRDLPKIIKSEQEVKAGVKSAEDHAELDAYERSKLYNWCNIVGSALVVVTYAIAVGISAGVGYKTETQKITSYRVLMGYFGAITVICTVPFFIVQKHRAGQQLPEGTKFWTVGPLQVWSAMKSAAKLKQCMLYLIAYFMLNETFGTYFNVTGLLQNEVIHYNPLLLNAMSLVADLSGGSGTLFILLMQKKFRFSVKAGVFYGACMTLIPSLWGGIGLFTNTVGFHHVWEFWLAQCWNFQTAAWGSYQVTMISEVVPAPKAFMFFALFNTVGKTSGFIGPFISSAIIERANGQTSACYWFLFAMGSVGAITLWFCDTDKAKTDIAKYLEREAEEYYSQEQREEAKRTEVEEDAEKI